LRRQESAESVESRRRPWQHNWSTGTNNVCVAPIPAQHCASASSKQGYGPKTSEVESLFLIVILILGGAQPQTLATVKVTPLVFSFPQFDAVPAPSREGERVVLALSLVLSCPALAGRQPCVPDSTFLFPPRCPLWRCRALFSGLLHAGWLR
jgi:hypothetical protein